jgi:Dual-action HEIGH metallo-peptidase
MYFSYNNNELCSRDSKICCFSFNILINFLTKNVRIMKRVLFSCGLIALASLTIVSCKKNSEAKVDPLAADRATVRAMSFDASDLQKVDGGYIVEGDIFLTDENVRDGASTVGVPAEEQWRTFNLVSVPGASRNITIRLASNLNTTFWNTVLQNAVNRYNALGSGFRLTFTKVATTSSANITVTGISGTGGSAGFPSGGNPWGSINMGTGIASCGTGTATTVMAHEMGHCIGFRHTDWFNRAYSCGSGGSEGQQTTGVGAVLIPGTPSTVVAGSWMLACYSCGGDRPFVSSDRTALYNLY